MKIVAFLVLACVLSASAARVPGAIRDYMEYPSSVSFGAAFKTYLDAIKNILPCGYSAWNLPALAPYSLDYYALNSSSAGYSILGHINNVTVTGLNNFKYIKYEYDESSEQLSYDIIFPEIQLLGEYNVDLNVSVAGYPVAYAGKGLINQRLIDLRVTGGFEFATNDYDGGLLFANLNVLFQVARSINNNWNNDLDTAANEFANEFADKFVKLALEEMQSTINLLFQEYFLSDINSLVSSMSSMQGLVSDLLQTSEQLQIAGCNSN